MVFTMSNPSGWAGAAPDLHHHHQQQKQQRHQHQQQQFSQIFNAHHGGINNQEGSLPFDLTMFDDNVVAGASTDNNTAAAFMSTTQQHPSQTLNVGGQHGVHHQHHHHHHDGASSISAAPDGSITEIDAQIEYLKRQKRQLQLQDQHPAWLSHHSAVPPTPQSLDLRPLDSGGGNGGSGSGSFLNQPDHVSRQQPFFTQAFNQHTAEQRDVRYYLPWLSLRQHQENRASLTPSQMAFTPLLSPDVTPLDPQFSMENIFATQMAAAFSPLTSPALHAQIDGPPAYDSVAHFIEPSSASLDFQLSSPASMPYATPDVPPQMARRSTAVTTSTSTAGAAKTRAKISSAKSSPISKPQRRKPGFSPAVAARVSSEVEASGLWAGDHSLPPLPDAAAAAAASAVPTNSLEENASVSPENLNDMMPPPPPPKRRAAPAKEDDEAGHPSQLPHPATPASLMKLSPSTTRKLAPEGPPQETTTRADAMEWLQLPEASMQDPPATLELNTPPSQFNAGDKSMAQNSRSSSTRTTISNRDGVVGSPSPRQQMRPSGAGVKKTPRMTGRDRKRSTGSVQASPALLPRISPSIKPLLPGLSAAEDSASQLLASKSNYQNILEGNKVPGVSYPSELSANLTSKRTSHKLAEQGRRNRINVALQTMAGLLPDSPAEEEESDKKEAGKTGGQTPNSKARVVECAIEHMRQLQRENGHLKRQVEELKSRLGRGEDAGEDAGEGANL